MKVQEVMERAGTNETGRAIAYIKDALQEIELYSKENVTSGSRASVTASTISFDAGGTEKVTNGTAWTGAANLTEPTGWTEYESHSLTDMGFSIDSGRLKMEVKGTVSTTQRQGMYQSMTLVSGVTYKLSVDLVYEDMGISIDIGESAPSGTTIASEMFANADTSDFTLGSTGSYTIDFTATATTAYITVYTKGVIADNFVMIDNLSVIPYSNIRDTATGLGNFTTNMKLRVNSSSSNDTDESGNASTGYYTPTVISSEYITVSDTLTTESASNTITLTGTNQNYMDIIEDKRYYTLPSDMIKLVGVKVKNHLNGDDKYRKIPRMIHPPIEEDEDNI